MVEDLNKKELKVKIKKKEEKNLKFKMLHSKMSYYKKNQSIFLFLLFKLI